MFVNRTFASDASVPNGNDSYPVLPQATMDVLDCRLVISQMLEYLETDDEREFLLGKREAARVRLDDCRFAFDCPLRFETSSRDGIRLPRSCDSGESALC